MEYTEIRDQFGQRDLKNRKFQLQMIIDGHSSINGYTQKIGERDIDIRLATMRDKIHERTGFKSNGIRLADDSKEYKNVVSRVERLIEQRRYNKDREKIGGKQHAVLTTKRDNALEFQEIERSLSRIKKSQDIVKTEMTEIQSLLEQKLSKVKESYKKISADVQELGHLVELGRFVNNKTERVDVRERLAIELNKMERSYAVERE